MATIADNVDNVINVDNNVDDNDPNTDNDNKTNDDDNADYITSYNNVLLDRAYGCCIGAAIGDSIGSFCEFRKTKIDDNELNEAMSMAGGGTWGDKVISGQVTDDTELAISLAYGLMDIIGKSSDITRLKNDNNDNKNNDDDDLNNFDLEKIAKEYKRWNTSSPFDKGFCTRATLYFAPNVSKMKLKAYNYNQSKIKTFSGASSHSIFRGNMANGSMMRCMPLCLYGYKLNNKNLYKLMMEDSSLTHCHISVYLVNTCYAIMVKSLLSANNNANRNKIAFNCMIKWLSAETKPRVRSQYEMTATDDEKKKEADKCSAAIEILNVWLENVDGNDLSKLHPATVHQGFIQIAFQRVCYHLLKGTNYRDAIRSVVSEGGDSDTNACIVGGIMGAYHGLSGIPDEYIGNIHKCNPIKDPKRDKFQAKWYFKDKICESLIQNAPTDDNFNIITYDLASSL